MVLLELKLAITSCLPRAERCACCAYVESL